MFGFRGSGGFSSRKPPEATPRLRIPRRPNLLVTNFRKPFTRLAAFLFAALLERDAHVFVVFP
jgi:hypothetical protein